MYTLRLTDGKEFGPASIEQLEQWARDGRVPRDALLVPAEGGEPISVHAIPSIAAVLTPAISPPMVAGAVPPPDEPLSGLIPYKNPAALVGYYLGLFSCIPVLGIIMGPIGIVLGIRGLRRRARDPAIKGSVHAWIAIVCGAIGTLINGFILLAIIMGALGP